MKKLFNLSDTDLDNIQRIRSLTGLRADVEVVRYALNQAANGKPKDEYITDEDAIKRMHREQIEEKQRIKEKAQKNMAMLQGTKGQEMLNEILKDNPKTEESVKEEGKDALDLFVPKDGVDDNYEL